MFHSAHETEECEDRTERKVVGSVDLVRECMLSEFPVFWVLRFRVGIALMLKIHLKFDF